MHRYVKIFGERNTSTNALGRVLAANSEAMLLPGTAQELPPGPRRLLRLVGKSGIKSRRLQEFAIDRAFRHASPREAWKHCAPDFDDVEPLRHILVLPCVRNPASWLLSLHKRPYHQTGTVPKSFPDFLTMRWRTRAPDNLQGAVLTPIELYNRKLCAYRELMGKLDRADITGQIVRFEAFAIDQKGVFDRIAPHLGVSAEGFRPLRASTKDAAKDADHYADYYGNERWRSEISTEAAHLIDRGIDWETAGLFGYCPDPKPAG